MLEELVGSSRGPDGCYAMRPESTFPPEEEQVIDEWMKSLACRVRELLRKANLGDARAALEVIPLLHDSHHGSRTGSRRSRARQLGMVLERHSADAWCEASERARAVCP